MVRRRTHVKEKQGPSVPRLWNRMRRSAGYGVTETGRVGGHWKSGHGYATVHLIRRPNPILLT